MSKNKQALNPTPQQLPSPDLADSPDPTTDAAALELTLRTHYEGMPFFVVFADDPNAPEVVRYWADLAQEEARPADAEGARQVARDMEAYYRQPKKVSE